MEIPKQKCRLCGKEFIQMIGNQTEFCSEKCKEQYINNILIPVLLEEHTKIMNLNEVGG